MIVIKDETDCFKIGGISIDELNLDKTFKCGQAFRWIKDNGNWCGVINNKVIVLRQEVNNQGISTIYTNLKDESINKLIDYLDLDTKYTDEIGKLNLDEYARKSYEAGKGIHILKQDLFEMIITFLMSQFNSMHNISIIIEKICSIYGKDIETEFMGKTYKRKSFPTLDELKPITYEEAMSCSVGFRTKYLLSLMQRLTTETLDNIKRMQYKQAMKALTSYSGIGVKVANCICLFSLHHVEAFPIDVHIQRIIDEEYNGHIDISRYGKYAGIVQQYMYYYRACS